MGLYYGRDMAPDTATQILQLLADETRSPDGYNAVASIAAMLDLNPDAVADELHELEQAGQVQSGCNPRTGTGRRWWVV